MRAPTGEQFELSMSWAGGSARAIITELAASLRVLEIDGVAVTEPYDHDSLPPFGCGIVLAPWPNRVRDGRWQLDGETQQLDLTEPARDNAIHGLLRNTAYRVIERSAASITLSATVFPQHGYPFLLQTSVRYEVVADGLDRLDQQGALHPTGAGERALELGRPEVREAGRLDCGSDGR